MANRIRQVDEKVQSVKRALEQINVEAAAREAGVPAIAFVTASLIENREIGRTQPEPYMTWDELACLGEADQRGKFWVVGALISKKTNKMAVHS